jgi:hypothetical protein
MSDDQAIEEDFAELERVCADRDRLFLAGEKLFEAVRFAAQTIPNSNEFEPPEPSLNKAVAKLVAAQSAWLGAVDRSGDPMEAEVDEAQRQEGMLA